MKKTYCDICKREINDSMVSSIIGRKCQKAEIIIHSENRCLDICDVCHNKIAWYVFNDMRGNVDPAKEG